MNLEFSFGVGILLPDCIVSLFDGKNGDTAALDGVNSTTLGLKSRVSVALLLDLPIPGISFLNLSAS